jgi:hypothetical protein
MEAKTVNIRDRVREKTSNKVNMKIDQKAVNRIYEYRTLTEEEKIKKLNKLTREWDIERALEVNASTLALTGVVLGIFGSKKWLFLPFLVSGFMLQFGLQGWAPPVALLRSLGFRTRQEIDEEIYALKTLNGDFDSVSADSGPIEILSNYRKQKRQF